MRLVKSNPIDTGFGHQHAAPAGWSRQVAHLAHNQKVAGSNPAPATNRSTQHRPNGGDKWLMEQHPVLRHREGDAISNGQINRQPKSLESIVQFSASPGSPGN